MTDVPVRVPERFSLHSISRSSDAFSSTSLHASRICCYAMQSLAQPCAAFDTMHLQMSS